MTDSGRLFLRRSAQYLVGDYLPRIAAAVAAMPDDGLWWRPNDASNSIGNLCLHLAGNLEQWVVHGVPQAPNARRREQEFSARGGHEAVDLLERLGTVVWAAHEVITSLDAALLCQRRSIQGQEVTVLEAIYHAVEHFGMHTGQIVQLAKAHTGRDFAFYEVRDGIATPRWRSATRPNHD